MKQYLAFLAFFFCSFVMIGQSNFKQWYPAVDTCDNAETITFSWGDNFLLKGDIAISVVVDSLSGAGDPTIYIDGSPHCNGTQFTELASQAVSGAQTEYEFEDIPFPYCRCRVRVVGTGTQSHKVQVSGVYKYER